MKIGIPSNGKELSQAFASVFGRCSYFVIVDSESQEIITVLPNKAQNAAGGAGIQAAQSLVNQEVDLVIAPRIGPNAWNVLQAAGIDMFMGINGTLNKNIETFLAGKLTKIAMATGFRGGRGRGRGGGRGGMGRQGQGRENY
ncbi:MAG: NifB/NifX family molybdenum-iron cluster-binding protein [Candidatus Heimdallarchaeota archaeon]|nr:MAG: NifB/NifX family molybdenum-iron cluster-binding protein [Candidatus Heimdallarchaeota archaeon]